MKFFHDQIWLKVCVFRVYTLLLKYPMLFGVFVHKALTIAEFQGYYGIYKFMWDEILSSFLHINCVQKVISIIEN